MNIKFIAMGLLATSVISTAVFADDMQQNMQQGTQANPVASTAMTSDQAKTMGMPAQQGTNPAAQGTAAPTTAGTNTTTTTGTTGNTTQTGTY